MSEPDVDTAYRDDPEVRELLDALAKDWAELPASAEGLDEQTLYAYIRQAYGAGYVNALRSREDALS